MNRSPLLLLLVLPVVLTAQTQSSPAVSPPSATSGRPIPGPVYESAEFTRAVQRGTRTRTGEPGPGYWVNRARYSIDASLDVGKNLVRGREQVVYRNNSPDTLRRIAVHLRQNAFAAGNPRNQSAPITEGVKLSRVVVNGGEMRAKTTGVTVVPITSVDKRRPPAEDGYTVDGTVLWIPLASPLLPRDSITLDFAWEYEPPLTPSDGRQGRDEHLYEMGYWYPQVAVYDDVSGWVADPYLLEAEFYMDHADYDVRLTVPRGWTVAATGTLRNASEILAPATIAKLAEARRSGAVVRVLTPGKDAKSVFTGRGRSATWHFVANDVRDFFWGASDRQAWDATRALVQRTPGAAPDTVDINSFFRLTDAAAAWPLGGARFTRDAIEQHSRNLWAYPWPTMSSMEGVLESGGMEYPMATVMQPWADTLALAGDLMHETGHMWYPMQVGSNETRYPWMDEGFTQFDVAQGMRNLYGEPRSGGRPGDSEPGQRELYLRAARAGRDMTLMWHGDMYPQGLYFIMFYDKTAQNLSTLRGILGDSLFWRAYREYGRRWNGKHPYPWDFFNTVNDVATQDLSWFWTTWFQEPWSLDQAIGSVATRGDTTTITIEDRGLAPMPVRLVATRANGRIDRISLPVGIWLGGARQYVVRLPAAPAITRIELDPEQRFPDVNRENQTWSSGR
ncbi:MAG TPA: M1 family metallopeptidase [Gemmatimonadaceae bacterium]